MASQFVYKSCYRSGIHIIADLLKNVDNFCFYTFEELLERYRINTNFLQVQGLITAVRRCMPVPMPFEISPVYRPFIPVSIHLVLQNNRGSKIFYNILNHTDTIATGKIKWNEQFNFTKNDWYNIYKLPFNITKNTKLQWLQYRVSHHILTTNSKLFKSGLVISPMCTFCNSDRETIVHLMWECHEVQDFLQDFETLLNALYIPFAINKQSILFGLINNRNVYYTTDNIIILIIKQYIYRSRCLCKSLNVAALVNKIKEYYDIQKYIANKSDSLKVKFKNNWKKWENLIQLDL